MYLPKRLTAVLNHLSRFQTANQAIDSCQTVRMTTQSPNSPTAGIIVIGDEILKGQTADTNSHFICKHLFAWGVKVSKISVISDELDTIAKEVRDFSKKYTHVITSGGIGPTHDDLTFEGVAKAFDEMVKPHPEIVELCKQYFGADNIDHYKLKLAMIPESAELLFPMNKQGEKTKFPLVKMKNVFVFPGIPSILERTFEIMEDSFRDKDSRFYTKDVFVKEDEISIAPILNDVHEKYRKQVSLGSYPDWSNSYYRVKLALESENEKHLEEVHRYLIEHLPPDCVVCYDQNPVDNATEQVYNIINSSEDSNYIQNVQNAVKVMEECLTKYKLEEICVGFNGGKDCTLLLHIFHAVVRKCQPDYKSKLKAMYIRSKLPFPEVEKFIQLSRDRYNLEMIRYEGPIKESLTLLLEEHPNIKAIIMGTRNTDPYSGHLEAFTMTDPDWPQVMRVNPILKFSYTDIWKFLRSLCVPYCSLYDRGYTSLGSMNDTHPSPSLQYFDKRGVVRYRPAYELTEVSKERDGRDRFPAS